MDADFATGFQSGDDPFGQVSCPLNGGWHASVRNWVGDVFDRCRFATQLLQLKAEILDLFSLQQTYDRPNAFGFPMHDIVVEPIIGARPRQDR